MSTPVSFLVAGVVIQTAQVTLTHPTIEYELNTEPDATDLADICDAVKDAVTDAAGWQAAMDSACTIVEATAQYFTTVDVPVSANYPYGRRVTPVTTLVTLTIDEAGDLSGDPVPPQCAALVSQYSITPGRRGRGRSYWSCASETRNDGSGGLDATGRSALQTTIEAMDANIDTVGTLDATPVVVSLAGTFVDAGDLGDPVLRPVVNRIYRARFATQRRWTAN
jgi:hypothetical protein